MADLIKNRAVVILLIFSTLVFGGLFYIVMDNADKEDNLLKNMTSKSVNRQEAVKLVKTTAKLKDQNIEKVNYDNRKLYITTTDDRIYWVDQKNGEINRIEINDPEKDPIKKSDLPLTRNAAIKRAEKYIKSVLPLLEKTFVEKVRLKEVKEFPGPAYEVYWEKVKDDIRIPRYFSIGIDATTGKFGSYGSKNGIVALSAKPNISAGEAIKIAKVKMPKKARIERMVLRITDNNLGRGSGNLIWRIYYQEVNSDKCGDNTTEVDAHTGK